MRAAKRHEGMGVPARELFKANVRKRPVRKAYGKPKFFQSVYILSTFSRHGLAGTPKVQKVNVMPKLTKRFVQNTQPPERGQVIYRDSSLIGLALRVTKGSRSYIVESRANGRLRRITLGKDHQLTPKEARKKAKKLLAMMASGKDPVREKAKHKASVVTLQQVLDQYLSMRSLRPRTRCKYRNLLAQRLSDWLTMPITDITRSMIETRHRQISTANGVWKASKAQANATMKVLKALLNFAADHYQINNQPILLSNPVRTLSQSKSWNRIPIRQGIVPDHKLAAWNEAVNSLNSTTVRDFLLLIVFTGLRHREASTLRFEDIDFEARTLTVRAEISKNHKEHRLPLSDFVFDLLKKRQESIDSPYVFPGRKGPIVQVTHSLNLVKKRSGCNFMVHDLRRVFLTTAERLGIPYVVLKKLANHSCGSDTTFGYIVVNVERLREPMEMISKTLLNWMHPSDGAQ